MRITIFGAAGDVGSRVVAEALSRGHEVTGVVRDPAQFKKLPEAVLARSGDAGNVEDVARLSAGQDVVISAIRPPDGNEGLLVPLTKAILDGAAQTGAAQTGARVLIVGGAASLKIPGQGDTTVLTAPNFLPDSVLDIARACFDQHEICRAEERVDWAYISPPASLTPGIRTGVYRLGSDELLMDADGNSAISMEDFAVALVDEAEQSKHHQVRFTVAY